MRGSTPSGSPRRVAPQRLEQEHQESLQREKEEAQQKENERQAEEREKEEQEVSSLGEWDFAQKVLLLSGLTLLYIFVTQVQRLQGNCEQQERQLKALRDELKKMSLGLEAFIITAQHYRLKVHKYFMQNQIQ